MRDTQSLHIPKDLLQLEYDLEHGYGHKDGLEVLSGNIPVIISAPHSVQQTRLGSVKVGEYRTATLGTLIHNATQCHLVYKTQHRQDDANYDAVSYYKDFLTYYIKRNAIRLCIDLHIMSPTRSYGVDIGTGLGNNIHNDYTITNKLQQSLLDTGIGSTKIDYQFKAVNPHTVSATVARECGIPAIQVEINWQLLDTESDYCVIPRLTESISSIIVKL